MIRTVPPLPAPDPHHIAAVQKLAERGCTTQMAMSRLHCTKRQAIAALRQTATYDRYSKLWRVK